ncbi:symmetrical bis(5'-nucleosyl)-tetraphosphatase [Agarivorans sp. MS3-6]|uniref:symmetrical bis(5'-nucleosyl)-tetraphosphatase n=1 Tax=Agarivorans sp. TSD2052 TaxID=2937286 RepID=UPI00200BBF98|nr:symmetrical bis(5'-nucleosyl)-tetraphosphatase [Agarivorans sp. TSD2052]UPW18033.1 symmetrical bis(5'-nucleosyl)-tetraphosphatase [Agarivorans sp. TSD2052]
MATYFVGDIQGCLDELKALLKQVKFSPKRDQLWLAGDLVARGPQSLETLRFVMDLGEAAQVVLGNHDLHLLAVANGIHRAKRRDKLHALLDAPDRDELLNWLRCQPLIAKHPEFDVVMVHAGIYPKWKVSKALKLGQEVQNQLSGDNYLALLQNMYGNEPAHWSDELVGYDRLRYIINVFTRMRYCFPDASLDFELKIPPNKNTNPNLRPWFELPGKHLKQTHIIFGHWAALMGKSKSPLVNGLDTGCVWGNHLTMLRWDDQRFYTQACLSDEAKA